MITATAGEIYVDQFKICDYDEKNYRQNVNYLTTKPFFFHGSILRNMKLIDGNKEHIIDVLKQVGIYDYILSLPKNLRHEANALPKRELYLLSLARLLLMKNEILILYEFPNYLSAEDKREIKSILTKFHEKKTILLFSANDDISDIADSIFEVERGRVHLQK